jgi:hypothetical protein
MLSILKLSGGEFLRMIVPESSRSGMAGHLLAFEKGPVVIHETRQGMTRMTTRVTDEYPVNISGPVD